MAGYSISYLTLWIYILIPVKTGSYPIQLFGGGSRCQGIVQILRKDVWLPVCDRFWNNTLTAMVCKELNCGNPTGSAVNGETTLSVNTTFLRVTCPDTDLLKACNISFVTEAYCRRPVVINCTDPFVLRLSGGGSSCAGRVEIFHDGVWGSVCDDGWDSLDAHVTCRQLGCGNALQALGASHYGPGPSKIHLDEIGCTGAELDLRDCPARHQHDCTALEHAGVICTNHKAVRVSGGADNCSGRVEVFTDGVWGTVCEDHWFEDEFAMLCNTLGCGSFVRKTCHNHSLSTYTSFICKDTASLWNCSIYHKNHNICKESKALGVVCKGSLETETSIPTKTSMITTARAEAVANDRFSLEAIIICGTLAVLLLISIITFTLIICRLRRLQRVSFQITSLIPTNENRNSTFRQTKLPVPASIPAVPSMAAPSNNDDYEFNTAPPAPLITFQDYTQRETDVNAHCQHQKTEWPQQESFRSSRSSSTSSDDENWYENYRGNNQGNLDLMNSPRSYVSSSEYDDVSSIPSS
ncbi:T-cell differentiation antigen CD6-like isoform X2 [Pelobates fuscus]|uniref:T-cell differentiation antigen CD6-like isoform X2 n=1 Tax=Pelobates fuscus TaxID=191477 RepID=UPI002FE44F5A